MLKTLMLLLVILQTEAMIHAQAGKDRMVVVANNAPVAMVGKVISIPWQQFSNRFNITDTGLFALLDSRTGNELPVQLETQGKGQVQNLLTQVDVASMESIYLQVILRKRKPVPSKVFGRFVPERKDDFAWENDHIAFRMYGKALETTNENAHGIDVWVKRTNKLVINDRYLRNDYHDDHGDGLDYYSVGNTLGAGNIAPYFKDSVWYPGNFSSWKIVDQGPLRITFSLNYDAVNISGHLVSSVKTISLDAGSWLNRVTVVYNSATLDTLPVVMGIVTRKEPGVMLMHEQKGIVGYWEPAHPKYGTTGTAIIANSSAKISFRSNQLLMVSKAATGVPFTYYAGACWDREGIIKNDEIWFAWLYNYKLQLKDQLEITYK